MTTTGWAVPKSEPHLFVDEVISSLLATPILSIARVDRATPGIFAGITGLEIQPASKTHRLPTWTHG